jgi:hypothetical protein
MELKPMSISRAGLWIRALSAGEFCIDSLECGVCQGVQTITLPNPLTIVAYDNAVSFSVKTDLPVSRVLTVISGECLHFGVFVTNTGDVDIDCAEIKFTSSVSGEISPNRFPIRQGDCVAANVTITVQATLKEIGILATCNRNDSEVESVVSFVQNVIVEAAIWISSIEPVLGLENLCRSEDELIYLAVNISNRLPLGFSYSCCFKQSPPALRGVNGLLTDVVQNGFLRRCETKVFIIGMTKEALRKSTESVDRNRIMAAVKIEEEALGQKVRGVRRATLSKRVGIMIFVEDNLMFEWELGGRKGTLTKESALGSCGILKELDLHRPTALIAIEGYEGLTVPNLTKVCLVAKYGGVEVVKAVLDLGHFLDEDYGIGWDGSLQGRPSGEGEFRFVLCFAKPGEFDLRIKYETTDAVAGHNEFRVIVKEV